MSAIRVVTYNVRYFGHATRGIASTGSAFGKIAASLAALDPTPDVVCLQEVETASIRATSLNRRWYPGETQLDRVMTELTAALVLAEKPERYNAYYFPAHAYRLTARTNIYTTGLAILAKDTLSVRHDNAERPHDITHRTRAARLKQTRICAHLAFEKPGAGGFDVFNTHLSLPSFLARRFWTEPFRMGFGQNQLAEAAQLSEFVDRERRSPNVVIVGDFNSIPGSPVDRYLREEKGYVDALSTVNAWSEHEARTFATAGFLNLRMHLDHVYSSGDVAWIDFDGTTPFGQEGSFAGLSDHVPLVGRFVIGM